jgi:hypothetical protein
MDKRLNAAITSNVRAKVLPLYDYWESTYIGAPSRGHRHAPLYRIESWNQLLHEQQSLPRTNSSVEGWHHGFQSMTGAHHQIFTFIECTQKEQSITGLQKHRLAAGVERPASLKSTPVRYSRRIQSLIHQYQMLPTPHFDNAVQHNLTLSIII